MKKRRKTVIAGDLVKIVEYIPPFPNDDARQRSAKRKTTSEAQKILNFRTAQGALESKLATNFSKNDYFATLTYSPDFEPANRKAANKDKQKYIRRLRDQRKRAGAVLKWVVSPENKHGDARWHFHAVINAADPALDREEIESLWQYGHVKVSRLFDSEHHFNTWLDVARYLTKERPEDGKDETPVNAQIYSCSRNLKKPIVITEWVDAADTVLIPSSAFVLHREEKETEFSRFIYFHYMLHPIATGSNK